MTFKEMEEVLVLKNQMNKMIEGEIPVDKMAIERYNELCRMRRDSEGH